MTQRRDDATGEEGEFEVLGSWVRVETEALGGLEAWRFLDWMMGLSQRPRSTAVPERLLKKRLFSLRRCVDPTAKGWEGRG